MQRGDPEDAFDRAFKGMPFKRSAGDRYDVWGGHKHTSWNRKLANRLANAPKNQGEQPKARFRAE